MDPASQAGAITAGSIDAGTIQEGCVRLQAGMGFFRPESRPSRDLGVLLAQHLAAQRCHGRPEAPGLRVLDLMAGCGIRSLRYGVEAGAAEVWANDADPDRLALLQANLAGFGGGRCTTRTAQKLLAGCLLREQRFDLIDLDAFGCPSALVPLALEALAFDGVLYLASTDGRSPTGHDRPAAIRSLGAAARAHPASWELALRLQLGVQARAAWVLGRGLEPLFSFSEGRTFRTAVRLRRKPGPQAERQLGLLAHCHGCGDQQVQSLLQLRQWRPCLCPDQANASLSISGPLWIGPLQDPASLEAMASAPGASSASLSSAGARLLAQLRRDDGLPARCWPLAELAKRLGGGPPPLGTLVAALRLQGWSAQASGVMEAQLRSDAPWERLLQVAAHVTRPGQTPEAQGGALNR
ncbi:MAG: N2,N2-dimethylguanosine tRNA methyltransferase [Synechococcus sp. ELA619]